MPLVRRSSGGGVMVVRCPFAVWKPLPEATSQSLMNEIRGLIYHTPVGTMRGTWDYFARASVGAESTFLLGCPLCGDTLDGVLWQIMDAARRADANVEGNRWYGSVEMCDHGDPSRPLSPRQLDSAVRLGRWYRSQFGTPGRLCPTPTSAGFGWHAMWLDTRYMHADRTTPWSAAPGKVCPGAVRIRQLKTIVFPAIFAGTDPEDDMPLTDADAELVARKIFATLYDPNRNDSLRKIAEHMDAYFSATTSGKFTDKPGDTQPNSIQAVLNQLGAVAAAVTDLAAKVAALPGGGGVPAPSGGSLSGTFTATYAGPEVAGPPAAIAPSTTIDTNAGGNY